MGWLPLHGLAANAVDGSIYVAAAFRGTKARVMQTKVGWWSVLLAIGVLAGTPLALGHHSAASTFHLGREITIEGYIDAFKFRNPHSFLHLTAVDENTGERTRWRVEWASASLLSRDGITRNSLQPGDRVVVRGNPARDPETNLLQLLDIKSTSGGWEWELGF